ncbi:MAG TPA: chromosomal replication initiator protein DnaA [Crocinitomix sp.]|nr:chromosomal replication initiator protein DnaA [Crocinitomix sp.]
MKNKKNHESIWANCLKVIKDNVSLQSFKTWFEPIKPIRFKSDVLTLQVPSHFFYEWLEEHYIDLLKKVIKKEIGPDAKLEYSIVLDRNTSSKKAPYTVNLPTSNKKSLSNSPVTMPLNVSENQIKNPFIIPGLKKVNVESNLNPTYTFDNFVEGDCNRLARSAAFAVANKPGGTAFNPLLLYGGVGLGKTHLAHAIGIGVKNNFPNKIVLYVNAEVFTRQFIDSIKNHTTNDFINFYKLMDVLIIDDVQFFAGKEKTQDAFFHIFNHLHQTGKQIVLTSDKAPVDMKGVEQRLLSRFKWGLSADLQAPGLETRIAILKKKIYGNGIEISEEVLEYLAYGINTNVREMEGALTSIIAQATLNKKAITLELAKKMIDKYVKVSAREVSMDYIHKIVCDYFNLPIELLKSKTRKREVVQARQIAMFFAKKMTKWSLASIGAQCGGKDHATVLHACRTVNNLSETDKQFRGYLEDLEKKLNVN